MREQPWCNEYRTTVVCVDGYENGIFAGRFYNPYLEQGQSFHSLADFLLKMESTLDTMAFPQSFAAVRSFSQSAPTASAPKDGPQQGRAATFALKVLFRQNASWQGSLAWLEGKREESFRSVLELIFLMDSALRPAEKR